MQLVDGHVAPAQNVLALRAHRALDQRDRLGARLLVAAGQKAGGDAVTARWWKLEGEPLAQEPVGQLKQDARPVTGIGVGALGAAVLEVLQRPQSARDHLVGGGSPEMRHEGDAAGVMLAGWVVEAARGPEVSGGGDGFLGFRAWAARG